MGTCIDFTFRFGGSKKAKMNKGLKHIREIQEVTAEYTGNGVCDFSAEPQFCDDGSVEWGCYCKAGDDTPNALRDQLLALAQGNDFQVWFYWECTDGCNESSLEHHQAGECTFDEYWNSGILGLDGSIAIAKLKHSCDTSAALTLLDSFLTFCDDGWDEDDSSNPFNAHLAAISLAEAFQQWPTLLGEHAIQSQLDEMHEKLAVLCGGGEFDPFDGDPEKVRELRALQAIVEAQILKQSNPVSLPVKTSAPATAGHRL
jgi:hypothetical protein